MKKWLFFLFFSFSTLLCSQTAPLPAKEVFQVQVKQQDPNYFTLHFQIKPHYFLYSDRLKITPLEGDVQIGTIQFPPALKNIDKHGHTENVYRNRLEIAIPVLNPKSDSGKVLLHYQGCSDDGFCYAPEEKPIYLTFNQEQALIKASFNNEKMPLAKHERIKALLQTNNWVLIFLTFFGFGLLLSFTPCILPMVPVLSGIIIGHGQNMTTRKAFLLSLSYVLSMSLTYAFVGIVVALLGANLQISMQSPWAIALFSFIFVILALSMFGFYEFKLPEAWQAKIGNSSRNQRGGHYWGAALMGCLSTLILSPCVTAPLIGALSFIAQKGNLFLGCFSLFFLSLGMGTPLLLIGTSAGRWLPQAGSWMNGVKIFFGVLFLAVATHLLSRILPSTISMLLWSALFIFSGIYCGALTHALTSKDKFQQGVGLMLFIYGVLMLVGASMGASDPLQPLKVKTLAQVEPATKQLTLKDIQATLANAQGKPVILDFYADWCNSCKIMEATTFQDPKVQEALQAFTLIKVNVTAHNKEDQAILDYFQVIAPPTFLFFNEQGKEIKALKLVGEASAKEFLQILQDVKSQNP